MGDRLARATITLAGLGTIVAVLLVGVFLLGVAVPLFRPATVAFDRTANLDGRSAGLNAAGTDEAGLLAWFLGGGRIRVISLADGSVLLDRAAADCGLATATAIRVLPTGQQAVVGFEDGTVRTGRIGLETAFLPGDQLPPGIDPAPGAMHVDGERIIARSSNETLSTIALLGEVADEPVLSMEGRIRDVDIARLTDGLVMTAVDATGAVAVTQLTSRRNLLTDEVISVAVGGTIPRPERADDVAWVRVSELGDQLFLCDATGLGFRYSIRDVETPRFMEDFPMVATGRRPVAVERLFGGSSLAVGDDTGAVQVFFTSRAAARPAADGLAMVAARTFPPPSDEPVPISTMAASPRSRLLATADTSGRLQVLQATNGRAVLQLQGGGEDRLASAATTLVISPRENRLLAANDRQLAAWSFDPGYPEVSMKSLFGRIWYENYPRPVHAWETTGHESFESKFGLVPLIFGTLKATLYSMLFATPIALLAAIYSSQFMHASWRARIKPSIEMMASLPSVVLGFIAGLIFAPVIERGLMVVLTGLFTVPLSLLCGAYAWQFWPAGWRGWLSAYRFAVAGFVSVPAGLLAAWLLASPMEDWLFAGDVRAWLDGRGGSGWGGWTLALLPPAGLIAAGLNSRLVSPWLRLRSADWTERQVAAASLGSFLVGIAVTVVLALAAALFFDALRLDTRGALFGTYVQRNAMVVAVGMSFAIIPLIFTIADDALSSVPEHLRSASLGAGATPWQTAVRVIVPAATSGLFSAVMIGLGRAVGETMIVLMAAGNTPLMNWNIFNGFQTLSAALATELPEAARGSSHYRVLFLAAVLLFSMTFVVNTAAEIVRQRFRRRAHDL